MLREQAEGEHRQWQRQVWGSALTWGAEPPKDLMARITPNYVTREEGAPVNRAAPYPVSKELATALGEAASLGLLDGPAWMSWPAARDGRPLIRIWEGIALSGGLT